MSYPKSRLGKLFVKKADLLRELDAVLYAIEGDISTSANAASATAISAAALDATTKVNAARLRVNGTQVTDLNLPVESVSITNGAASLLSLALSRSKIELDDIFGSDLRQDFRVDPNTVTLNATTISALADRVGCGILAQGTAGNQPTYVTGDPAFGGRPCADFGNTTAHSRLLYSATTRLVDREYSRFVIYRANVDLTTSNGRILGNGDASRLCEVHLDSGAPNLMQVYNGGGGSIAEYDKTSLLGHLILVQIGANGNPKSGGLIYRSDGLITHLGGANIVTPTSNGTFAIGGSVFATVGAPVRIAQAGEIFGIPGALRRGGLIRYVAERYNWTLPNREVMFDGNSLNVKATLWPSEMVLANTHSRYYAAVGGRTTQQVLDALRSSALNETCGVTGMRRAWVGSEISNSVMLNVSGPDTVAQIQALIAAIQGAGFTDIVMGSCTPRGGLNTSQEAARVYVNTWLASNWQSAGITRLANLHTATPINGQACPSGLLTATDPVYYLDQGGAWVHNTVAGYALRSEQYRYWLAQLGY